MICPDCEKGMVRLRLSNGRWSEEGLFPKSLSGFQTVPCPKCDGSGIAYRGDGEDYDDQCHSDPSYGDHASIR